MEQIEFDRLMAVNPPENREKDISQVVLIRGRGKKRGIFQIVKRALNMVRQYDKWRLDIARGLGLKI